MECKKEKKITEKKQIWSEFVNGDTDYFEKLFRAFYSSMYGYGIKISNQPTLVKDCIQELFESVWKRREALDHITSPQVYLFVSLRRKILKRIKKNKRANGNLDEFNENDSIEFSKEELIIRDEVKFEEREKLQQALNQLSNRQKEVIYLHFYNGMSYGEIEQILSINRQSVRNHIYRGMETLRSLLDSEIMKLVISLLIGILLFV